MACQVLSGIGEKTAATLLVRHGSLDQILTAAHDPTSEMAKGLRTKLLTAASCIQDAEPARTTEPSDSNGHSDRPSHGCRRRSTRFPGDERQPIEVDRPRRYLYRLEK